MRLMVEQNKMMMETRWKIDTKVDRSILMHCVFSLLREMLSFIMPTVGAAKDVFFFTSEDKHFYRFIGALGQKCCWMKR